MQPTPRMFFNFWFAPPFKPTAPRSFNFWFAPQKTFREPPLSSDSLFSGIHAGAAGRGPVAP